MEESEKDKIEKSVDDQLFKIANSPEKKNETDLFSLDPEKAESLGLTGKDRVLSQMKVLKRDYKTLKIDKEEVKKRLQFAMNNHALSIGWEVDEELPFQFKENWKGDITFFAYLKINRFSLKADKYETLKGEIKALKDPQNARH